MWLKALALTTSLLVLGAEPQRELSVRDLQAMPRFSIFVQFAVSPDNAFVAYSVTRPGGEVNSTANPSGQGVTELWLTDLHSHTSKTICCGKGTSFLPSWSPDGHSLAFYTSDSYFRFSNESISEFVRHGALGIWDRNTGEITRFLGGNLARQAISSQSPPVWLKDNHSLLILSRATSVSDLDSGSSTTFGNRSRSVEGSSESTTVRVLSTLPSANNERDRGEGFGTVNRGPRDSPSNASVIDIKTGTTKEILRDIRPSYPSVSPDRAWFAYATSANPQGTPPGWPYQTFDVHLLNLDTMAERKALSGIGVYIGVHRAFSWSPAGRFLVVPDQRPDKEFKVLSDYIIFDLSARSTRRLHALAGDAWFSDRRVVWSSDAESLSVIRNNCLETWSLKTLANTSRIAIQDRSLLDIVATTNNAALDESPGRRYSVILKTQSRETFKAGFWAAEPASNRSRVLLEDDKAFSYFEHEYQELLPDGSGVLFVWESVDRPAELFKADTKFKTVKIVTNLAFVGDHVAMGQSQIIRWRDGDGTEVKGALLLPAGFEPGRRYPLIVAVWPSEFEATAVFNFGMSNNPSHNWQVFASRGYAVFKPNIPISPKSMMVDIARSVLPGIQRVIDLGVADPSRVGVIGHSNGGYASLALIAQSDKFRAAVMMSGHGNLIDFDSYDQGRIIVEVSLGLHTTPWEDLDVFIKNSPYFTLNKIRTPLLIITGTADVTVPSHLSEEVFNGLRRLGKEAVLVEYDAEGHDPQSYSAEHQVDLSNRLIAWFDKYLKADAPQRSVSSSSPANPN